MKKITLIVGARPNFMKAFPVYESLKSNFELTLIHTGQHFDEKMSKVFFDELGFPKPDIHFDLTSKSRAGDLDNKLYVQNKEYLKNIKNVIDELVNYDGKKLGQLGEIRDKLYNHFEKSKPDMVIVFGDVTSTLSASLACKKLNIEISHVESGLRSGDLSMPEEVNRILTDNMSSYFFVTEQAGVDNLKNEGITENVFLVGNTMIDTQKKHLNKALNTKYNEKIGVKKGEYVLITLHRPSNVDDMNKLREIFDELFVLSKTEKLVYPIHPRTKTNLEKIGYLEKIKANKNIILDDPLGYLEFTCLIANCKYLVTDSGGLQEESTALNIPCFTLRENTERPATLIENQGTNQMIRKISDIKLKECKGNVEFWDGESSKSIEYHLLTKYVYSINNPYNFKKYNVNNLKEQIKIGDYHYKFEKIDFLYKNKNKKNLLAMFHGSRKKYDNPIIFRGFNKEFDDFDIISFADPAFIFYPTLELNWFLNNKIDTFNKIVSIINNIKKKYSKIIFFGSSGGGYISILLSAIFNQYSFITNSQIYIKNYYYYKKLLTITKNNSEYIDIDKFLESYKPKCIYIYQNKNDIDAYRNHYVPFLDKWKGKLNIVSNLFTRDDLTSLADHHGVGQFPFNSNFDNEFNINFKNNILIIQNNINIGGAQYYGLNIAKVFKKYNITFLLGSECSMNERKNAINFIGSEINIIYDLEQIKNKYQDLIFVNSFPMYFVNDLQLYLLELKKYGDKILPILHTETNRFTLSISQIKDSNKYFNYCICVFERLKEKLKIENINGITIYPPFISIDEIKHTKNINKTKILGFYGRILPYKGVFLLVKYWEILSKKYPDWKLVITGNYTSFSKKYNDDIIQYINNNKLNSIIEINNKDINGSSEKNEVFNNMNIFVQLSLYEGLPFTVLEALENKTPVIHTNVGGIEELKNSNMEILNFKGLTFNNFDFIDYDKVISDNLYNKYFNENYIIFEKAFDKMVLKNNNFDNFEKVIEKFNFSNFEKKLKNIL